MQVPLHPLIIHFPIALTFVLPVLILVFAFLIKSNKISPKSWLVIIGLQIVIVGTGYISLETGETEEDVVQKVLGKELIHAHEEASEVFVGSTVIGLVISLAAFFIRKEIQFPIKLLVAGISLTSCFLAYRTAKLGGELVYVHGAASAYRTMETQDLLPTPEKNTSESTLPINENESLNADENDYGNADEEIQDPEDNLKQED